MQGAEVAYQDPLTRTYLGSPSIVRLPGGDLIATHDYFGPGAPLSAEGEEFLTTVYCSHDDGHTWKRVTHVAGSFWSGLFLNRGVLFLLGTSQGYGSIVIRRSDDGGHTWSRPADEHSGLLFRGGFYHEPPNYHCAPVPVESHRGRLYRAFEDCSPFVWGPGFRSLVISADADADLLQASSWTMSNSLAYDPAWTPVTWGNLSRPGWLEGNVVATPSGEIWNILRFHADPLVDKAAVVQVLDEGRRLAFDADCGFIDLPGGGHKFTIRRDPLTGAYLTLSNNNTDPAFPRQRNVLSLHASRDLRQWQHMRTLLEDDSALSYEDSMRLTGFQYVDWQFDGDDLLYLVRTSYDGAHTYHDSNRMVFHRLQGFRSLIQPCSRQDGAETASVPE